MGLIVSLLPRTSFESSAAGDIVDAVGPVWPDSSVEQVLETPPRVVSEIRIWAAAGDGRGEAPVIAGLVQGPTREIVRQFAVKIQPSKLLQPYILEFAPYRSLPGEELSLQFWVSTKRSNYVIFGTTEKQDPSGGPTINLELTKLGPVAYDMIWRGDGWRAALEGSALDRLRLVGAIASAVLAVALQPVMLRALRRALRQSGSVIPVLFGPGIRTLRRIATGLGNSGPAADESSKRRAIYVYPWLIPSFAILHYLATNILLLRAYEAIVPGLLILAGVTVVFAALSIVMKSGASAALLTGLLGIVFFAYGHVYNPSGPPDSRLFFGIAVPLVIAIALVLRARTEFAHRTGRLLNVGAAVLLLLPVGQLVVAALSANLHQPKAPVDLTDFSGLDERISDVKTTKTPAEFRDIYFIILDTYPRSGSPSYFDNSVFITELERRGFYVDPYARSNYTKTQQSVSTTLNLNYLESIGSASVSEPQAALSRAVSNHALGRIIKSLGYNYIHVSSQWFLTITNPNADVVVSFGPNGRVITGFTTRDPCVFERMTNLSNEFITGLLKTTPVAHFAPSILHRRDPCLYHWENPMWSLEWLEFMGESAGMESPKFVFAHLLKPHAPFTFDQYGNISPTLEGWGDGHDPKVESAFYGQIRWLNREMLDVIDSILAHYESPPIIVIMSDHGVNGRSEILAAYLLPDGGASVIYPSITSVNVFRVILNYYFDLDLELLDDNTYSS